MEGGLSKMTKKLFKNTNKYYYLVYLESFGWDLYYEDLYNKNLLSAVLRDIKGHTSEVYRFKGNVIQQLDLETDGFGLPTVTQRDKLKWITLEGESFQYVLEKIEENDLSSDIVIHLEKSKVFSIRINLSETKKEINEKIQELIKKVEDYKGIQL